MQCFINKRMMILCQKMFDAVMALSLYITTLFVPGFRPQLNTYRASHVAGSCNLLFWETINLSTERPS